MCYSTLDIFVPLLHKPLEQRGDKLHGDHTALLSWQGCHAYQRGRVVGGLQAQNLTLMVLIVL